MDENIKAKHDMMTKILGWGMVVYFLVLGYSLNQHALFELYPTNEQKNVADAKRSMAKLLRENNNQNNAEASNINIKAAEADLEAKILEDDMRDGRHRAMGLINAATVFFISYLLLIYIFYRKFKTEMSGYIVPKWIALVYAVFIGGSILVTAIMIAIN